MGKKVIFLLIDGLGDVNVQELDNHTPLQHAYVPTMDFLAQEGISGLLDPIRPGVACGSDTAHLSILGYDPRIHFRGRGAYESVGAGLDMQPGDIAFKSTFAFMDEDNIVVRRRCDDSFHEWGGDILCDYLSEHLTSLPSFKDVCVTVKYATEHRCGVRIRGANLSDAITGTDPLKDNLPLIVCTETEPSEDAKRTSAIVNEVSNKISNLLSIHPIIKDRLEKKLPITNAVMFRGCAQWVQDISFDKKYNFKSFMIAPTAIIAGIGVSLGMHLIKVPGATGTYHTDYIAKGRACIAEIYSHDFGFLHIKAVDEAGHNKDPLMKVKCLEKIDLMLTDMMKQLCIKEEKQEIKNEFIFIVTGDHSTMCASGEHSPHPVPFVISRLYCKENTFVRSICMSNVYDNVIAFDEVSVARGGLGRFCGSEVIPLIKNVLSLE